VAIDFVIVVLGVYVAVWVGSQQALADLDEAANSVLHRLYEPDAKTESDLLNYPMRLNVRISYLEDEVDYGGGAPTEQFRQMAVEYRSALDAESPRQIHAKTVPRRHQQRPLTQPGDVIATQSGRPFRDRTDADSHSRLTLTTDCIVCC